MMDGAALDLTAERRHRANLNFWTFSFLKAEHVLYQINDYQSPFSTMCVQPEDIFILRMKSIQLNTCDTFSEQCLIVW